MKWLLTLASWASLAAATNATYSSASIKFDNNRRLLFDSDGNQIDAYGSKVQFCKSFTTLCYSVN